jgi:hypothetical protein
MDMHLFRCSLALIACFAPALPALAQKIGNGSYSVEVNANGLLVEAPPEGLRTVDGPRAVLGPRPLEWFGVSFSAGDRALSGVGCGATPDWGQRMPVERIGFRSSATSATCVSRLGPMQIRTEFTFDETGPYLLAAVTLSNLGPQTLSDILYTREWFDALGPGWTFPEGHYPLPEAPPGICRRAWMLDDLPPGSSNGIAFSYEPDVEVGEHGNDVPLHLWTHPTHPNGVVFGATNGISFGDYDRDGFIDVFACQSGRLWRNVAGADWELAADFIASGLIPSTIYRYGSSFGDFDDDGFPDIGLEPRDYFPDRCLHLLRNYGGGGKFRDMVSLGYIVPRCGDSETWCWADVDGDGRLDAFVPFYPNSGNAFYQNRGPTPPAGLVTFHEKAQQVGLFNPPGAARPEGAQFADLDGDGDLDLYSNGTIYANTSSPGKPEFMPLLPSWSGVLLKSLLDEGAAFADYDLDGDLDLLIVYSFAPGTTIWESRGDGTFFQAEPGIVDSPMIGLDLGLSAEDWDNDGDVDFTTRQVFRRNMLIETGQRHFIVATHSIPAGHITSATPAWGDWDHDGDLDCALGNWLENGRFYENDTYVPKMPVKERRFVRVRPLRDSTTVSGGLETEYGAAVEVRVLSDDDGWRRRKFVSSAGGYLNQNEYALTFGLEGSGTHVAIDVAVDFPAPEGLGIWRVDEHVNPKLAGLEPWLLASREIEVFRSGDVRIDNVLYPKAAGASPLLATSAGGLVRPSVNGPLSAPAQAPFADWFVGLALGTRYATQPTLIRELLVDGQLAPGSSCAGAFNIALWDVTSGASPQLVQSLQASTSPRNHRTSVPWTSVLAPGREYRLVARMASFRPTPISGALQQGELTVHGGLLYVDPMPCTGTAVVAAPVDATNVYLAVRFAQ